MSGEVEFGELSREDRLVVSAWLHGYLHWHLTTWSEATGLGWEAGDVDAHIRRHDLTGRDWSELVEAAADSQRLVRTLCLDGELVGIIYAKSRIDPFLEVPLGVLAWVYVLADVRGQGYGRMLMDEAGRWMRERSLAGVELMVTGANRAALSLYEAAGYRVVDHRMLAPLPAESGPAE